MTSLQKWPQVYPPIMMKVSNGICLFYTLLRYIPGPRLIEAVSGEKFAEYEPMISPNHWSSIVLGMSQHIWLTSSSDCADNATLFRSAQ